VRLVHRDLPAGTLSTKDALDDGNAYDSAIKATASGFLTWQITIVKSRMSARYGVSPSSIDSRSSGNPAAGP
jgi:hypothetical protein